LDAAQIRWSIRDQEKFPRNEGQGGLNLDSTQRPLRGAFLIPPVPPVVLIGDNVTVDSTPGRGSTFTLRVPVTVGKSAADLDLAPKDDANPGTTGPGWRAWPSARPIGSFSI
jgi:hypothetical protein